MLAPDDVVVPAPKVAYRKVGEQVVLVSPDDNSLITLNETGSVTWMALDGRTVGEVAVEIEHAFDVPPEKALEDVQKFLESFLERALVERAGK